MISVRTWYTADRCRDITLASFDEQVPGDGGKCRRHFKAVDVVPDLVLRDQHNAAFR